MTFSELHNYYQSLNITEHLQELIKLGEGIFIGLKFTHTKQKVLRRSFYKGPIYLALSRAQVFRILSDLKKGEYIMIEKGKLMALNKALPNDY